MIDLCDIKKTYRSGAEPVEALKGVNLHIDDADIFGVIGYSGAGKSTLIRCVNLLERPDSGRVVVNGREMTTLSAGELREARQKIGMIFQHFNLLKSGTVFENVALPLKNLRLPKQGIQEKVNHLLELVGLADKASVYPSQLSGGQKQRVAIARALANDPEVLLSDEATSALDPQTTYSILALLDDLNKKLGLTIVLITHEMQVIKEVCNKVAVLDNGVIVEQGAVIDVFSQPKHGTTKKFIANLFQAGKIDVLLQNEEIAAMLSEQGILARLLFVSKSANRAYISEVSRKFQINASIVFGNIDIVKSIPIGNLFVVFHGDSKKIWLAIQYLEQEGVGVEFIQRGEGLYEKGDINLAKPFSSSHAESGGAV